MANVTVTLSYFEYMHWDTYMYNIIYVLLFTPNNSYAVLSKMQLNIVCMLACLYVTNCHNISIWIKQSGTNKLKKNSHVHTLMQKAVVVLLYVFARAYPEDFAWCFYPGDDL